MGISLRKCLDSLVDRPKNRDAVAVAGDADFLARRQHIEGKLLVLKGEGDGFAVSASDATAAASCRAVRAIGPQAASTVRQRAERRDFCRF